MEIQPVTPEELTKFITYMGALSPIDFIGILKILDVKFTTDETQPRDYDQILSEVIDRYIQLNKPDRTRILSEIAPVTKRDNRKHLWRKHKR